MVLSFSIIKLKHIRIKEKEGGFGVECAIKDNKEIIEKEQEIILPIRKSTPPSSLKVAAVNYLKTYKAVHLDCIG